MRLSMETHLFGGQLVLELLHLRLRVVNDVLRLVDRLDALLQWTAVRCGEGRGEIEGRAERGEGRWERG